MDKIDIHTQMGVVIKDNHVTHLGLHHCQLKSLPETIGNLTSLLTLSANFNKLKSVPDSIGDLGKLENLNLAHNELDSLPISSSKLKSLKKLNMTDNLFENIPNSVLILTNWTENPSDNSPDRNSLVNLYLGTNPLVGDSKNQSILKELKKKDVNVLF